MTTVPSPRGGSPLAIALDPTHAADFDRVVRVAIRALNAPVAQFNLVTDTEQVSVSSAGPGPWHGPRAVGLDASYCRHVVSTGEALVIDDARTHPLVRDNRATTEAGIGAYAAVPVILGDGTVAGSLCVVDFEPRVWTTADKSLLEDLAASLVGRIELARYSRESERARAHLDHVLASSGAHVYTLTLEDGRVTGWWSSANLQRFAGYRPEETLAPSWWEDAVHPADRERASGALPAVLAADAFVLEYRFRHRDGHYLWLHDELRLVRDAQGRPVEIIGTWVDITSRRTAEDALQASHDELELRVAERTRELMLLNADLRHEVERRRESERALVQSQERMLHITSMNPAGLWAIVLGDGGWDYTWMAEGVESVIGYTREEVLAPGWWRQHVHPADSAAMGPAMAEMRDRGRARVEYRIRQKDGSYRWIRSEGRAVLDGDRLVEVFGAWIDVTDRRESEAALRDAEDLLRHAQKMEAVGKLAGGVAHDFNNLLTVILAYGNMLAAQLPAGSDGRFGADEIVSAAQRAARLTHQLLAFSRKQVLDPRALHLNEVVQGMEGLLARLIGSNIQTISELAADLAECVADHGQVEQVLMNLAVNARDAMPDGGTLGISTRTVTIDVPAIADGAAPGPGRYVMLSVRDTGIGMDDATRARIFDPFFTTKEVGRGTGLGLSTVYGIIKQSGGGITVESAPGRGSTFRAYFPVASAAALPHLRATTEKARSRPSTQPVDGVILVADDNPQVRGVTRTFLERRGYTVLEAENGQEALSLLADSTRRVDLVVSDIVMPVLGGLQLVQRLGDLRPDTRVLLVSGYTADAVIQRGGLPAGIAFLEKPFSEEALLESVAELLASAPRAGGRSSSGAVLDALPLVAVVDDTELNRVLVSMLLEDRYRVHTHAGGLSAVDMLGELEPDLILLDIDMPEVSGFELLEAVRAHPRLAGCRVIAFTASDSAEARKAYERAGFDAFIGKPIADPQEFLERIGEEVRLASGGPRRAF